MLTLGGGDANLHDMDFKLQDLVDSIVTALSGDSKTKSYGDRQDVPDVPTGTPGIKPPEEKSYYKVKFEYPLTEASFKGKFRLPGVTEAENSAPVYTHVELRPEDWGPGHTCYGFDTKVPPGQICGTLREDIGVEEIKGVSRTCRVDQCVAFIRVETALCTCQRKKIFGDGSRGPHFTGGNCFGCDQARPR